MKMNKSERSHSRMSKFCKAAVLPSAILLTTSIATGIAAAENNLSYRAPALNASATRLTDSIPRDKLSSATRQLVYEGVNALDAKDYEKASAVFNLALRTDINNSYIHFLNGLVYHIRGIDGEGKLYALAQQGYEMAIQFDASNTIARHYLGLLYMDRREYKMAKEQLMEASLYSPNDAELLFDLAVAAYYAKDPAISYAALQGVLTANENTKSVELMRALAIVSASAGDGDAARLYLTKLAELLPGKENSGFATGQSELGFVKGRVDTWNRAYEGSFIKTQFPSGGGGSPFTEPAIGGGSPFTAPATGGGSPFTEPATGGGSPFTEPATGGGSPFTEPATGGGSPFAAPATGGGSPFTEPATGGGFSAAPAAGGGMPRAGGSFYEKSMVMLDVAIISQGKRIIIFRQTKRYSESCHPKRPSNVFS